MKLVFVMVVGPGEAPIAIDTLNAVREAHPTAAIVVRDDATTDGTYTELRSWAAGTSDARLLVNTKPYGYRGIARSLFETLADVEARTTADDWIVIKIDPDTLLLGNEITDAASSLLRSQGPGLLGAIREGPRALRDSSRERRNMRLDMWPVGPSKVNGRVRVGRPFWAPYLRRAQQSGYEIGVGVQGGFVIASGLSIRLLAAQGFWDRIDSSYRAMTYEEDLLLSLGVASLGHSFYELSAVGVPCWVQHKPPLPFDGVEACDRNLRVIHPLKDDAVSWAIRAALKNDLRARRTTDDAQGRLAEP